MPILPQKQWLIQWGPGTTGEPKQALLRENLGPPLLHRRAATEIILQLITFSLMTYILLIPHTDESALIFH